MLKQFVHITSVWNQHLRLQNMNTGVNIPQWVSVMDAIWLKKKIYFINGLRTEPLPPHCLVLKLRYGSI